MPIFESEPGDYTPPAPWEPEIEETPEAPPVDTRADWEKAWQERQQQDRGGDVYVAPEPSPNYPEEYRYQNAPRYQPPPPLEYNPNAWWASERALQEKWVPQLNPGPTASPYSNYYGPAGEVYGNFKQQPGVPESMFQQGKGLRPGPQFRETVDFTPTGYHEILSSPTNWAVPDMRAPQLQPPLPRRPGGGGGGYRGASGGGGYGGMTPEEYLQWLQNLLRYAGLLRI